MNSPLVMCTKACFYHRGKLNNFFVEEHMFQDIVCHALFGKTNTLIVININDFKVVQSMNVPFKICF